MAEKVSLKIFIVISFLCVILSACMVPIDIEVFLDDPQVQIIIESTKKPPPSVKVDPDSDDPENSLKAGDGFISGLIPGKYYRVEEYDQDKNKKDFFLQSDGKLNADLGKIGVLPEGKDKIEGLTNNYLYKVILAQPFDKNGTYKYFTLTGSVGSEAGKSEDEGITKVAVKITESNKYYLDLTHEIKVDNIYKVKANIESWNSSSRTSAHSKLTGTVIISPLNIINKDNYILDFSGNIGIYQYRSNNDNSITFITEGNIPLTDKSIIELDDTPLSNYVFVEYKDAKPGSEITNFTVLRVELKQTPSVSDFNISGNETIIYDGSPKTVTITPREGKSQGNITLHYKGISGTSYDSTTAPTNVGTYTVTFDVAADNPNWNEATGLSAGTLTIVEKTSLFNVTVVWSDPEITEPKPSLVYSGSGFTPSTGALVIDVTITNHTNWSKFEWTASHSAAPLVSEDTDPSHGYHLLLNLNASTTGLVWSAPGAFTIKVLVNGMYDAEVTFTPISQ